MSGNVYQFGGVTLPSATPRWNLSAAATKQTVKTLGGAYDPVGTDTAELRLPFPVTVNALAYGATASALGATLDDYRALVGKRDRLWLDPADTTQVDRFCWARLTDINYTGAYSNRQTQPVELVFEALTGWQGHAYGGAWDLDAGYLFDNGLYFDGTDATPLTTGANTITLTNAGNRTVTNVGITVRAGDTTAFGTVTVTVASLVEWTWTGVIDTLAALVIDCGSRRVLNDGAAEYTGFSLGANHYSAHWLPLAPGNTDVVVTIDAAGGDLGVTATAQFTYADGWV